MEGELKRGWFYLRSLLQNVVRDWKKYVKKFYGSVIMHEPVVVSPNAEDVKLKLQ